MLKGLIDRVGYHDVRSIDPILAATTLSIIVLGLVMVASASVFSSFENHGHPYFYLIRQCIYVGLGLVAGIIVINLPTSVLNKYSIQLMFVGGLLLVLVLLPGIGKSVNGSQRWINLGVFNLQASEVAKVTMVIYVAGFFVRRSERVRSEFFVGAFVPMLLSGASLALLLKEPDFGASVVLIGTVFALLFIAGAPLVHFAVLILISSVVLVGFAFSQEYRVKRMMNFWDPWSDPFNEGYQLSQALIAFGRGEWFGLGLGNSVQKLAYLPEAHTDFVFSVWVEETGAMGGLLLLTLFAVLVWRIFAIGNRAMRLNQQFQGYICYGFAILLVAQVIINIGVNTGFLPTKGLTLPLISYGGSSLIVTLASLFIVARVDIENHRVIKAGGGETKIDNAPAVEAPDAPPENNKTDQGSKHG